jgi:hypothetical protein
MIPVRTFRGHLVQESQKYEATPPLEKEKSTKKKLHTFSTVILNFVWKRTVYKNTIYSSR